MDQVYIPKSEQKKRHRDRSSSELRRSMSIERGNKVQVATFDFDNDSNGASFINNRSMKRSLLEQQIHMRHRELGRKDENLNLQLKLNQME